MFKFDSTMSACRVSSFRMPVDSNNNPKLKILILTEK